MTNYPATFYEALQKGVRQSAEAIVPLAMKLARPRRVIDVGCGLGTWLSVFQKHGVQEILGVDGAHVDRQLLEIPQDSFLPFDLTKPLRLEQRFDLVVSLEVAEHLPTECAETFVESLTGLGPAVLFSAAIPFQEGQHHVNEQWPDYWAGHFRRSGFTVVDCLRNEIWTDQRVAWWYRQNLFMFIKDDVFSNDAVWRAKLNESLPLPMRLVHPEKHLEMAETYQKCLAEVWQMKSELAAQDIHNMIRQGETIVWVDQARLTPDVVSGYKIIPFLGKDGKYLGPPPDDRTAIEAFRGLQEDSVRYAVFAWPAFWWLDHYKGLADHLRANGHCILNNNRLMVFDMKYQTGTGFE